MSLTNPTLAVRLAIDLSTAISRRFEEDHEGYRVYLPADAFVGATY